MMSTTTEIAIIVKFSSKREQMLDFKRENARFQREKMAAVGNKRLAILTIETISSMRNKEIFNAMYDLYLKEIKKLHFIEDPVLKQKRKAPNYTLINYFVEGYKSTSEAYYPDNPRDNYRQQFYQAIDVLTFSVRYHFDQPSFLVFEQLEKLLLKALKGEDISSELEFVREKYGDDVNINDLIVEFNIFKVLFKDTFSWKNILDGEKSQDSDAIHYVT